MLLTKKFDRYSYILLKKKNLNEDLNFSTGNWIFILLCKNRAASCNLFATFKNLNTALELFSYMYVHNMDIQIHIYVQHLVMLGDHLGVFYT
jgi:hypothetical protein